MKMKGMICLGIITKPYGVRGQVKISPYTSSPDSFLKYSKFCLEDGSDIIFKNMRANGKSEIIANIDGINDRNSVELFRLKKIFTRRDNMPILDKDEYYLADLFELEVFGRNSQKVGIVKAALDYGAGAFLEVKLNDNAQIATLPFNKNSILEVDLNQGFLKINESFLLK